MSKESLSATPQSPEPRATNSSPTQAVLEDIRGVVQAGKEAGIPLKSIVKLAFTHEQLADFVASVSKKAPTAECALGTCRVAIAGGPLCEAGCKKSVRTVSETAASACVSAVTGSEAKREDFIQVNDTLDVAECCVHDQIKNPLEREETQKGLKRVRDLALSALRLSTVATDDAIIEAYTEEYYATVNGELKHRDSVNAVVATVRRFLPPATTATEADKQDAERYRALRQRGVLLTMSEYGPLHRDQLDLRCDEMMATDRTKA